MWKLEENPAKSFKHDGTSLKLIVKLDEVKCCGEAGIFINRFFKRTLLKIYQKFRTFISL